MEKQINEKQLNLPTTFTFHEDPGHGWLEVPYQTIVDLGIQADITGYSYRQDGRAYLEEDLDAATFIMAYNRATGRNEDDWTYFNSLAKTLVHNGWCFIRNLPNYTI
ncbi:hypothetical protein [Olivibacter jilunii]|uniref:hypothetical protein n=1 Tax=Olivibacter jilunii TaxID=985016 RepID=UPI00102F81AF|nr:hypothetical protein [Olivibacter jilunii]